MGAYTIVAFFSVSMDRAQISCVWARASTIRGFGLLATARIIRPVNRAHSPDSLRSGASGLFAVTNPRDKKWERLKTPSMHNQAA